MIIFTKHKMWFCLLLLFVYPLISGCAEPTSSGSTKPTFQRVFDVDPSGGMIVKPTVLPEVRSTKYPQWLPPADLDGSRTWEGIIIHHSATDYGDATTFDTWHREKGWDELGYHFVIDNGISSLGNKDGQVEVGTRWLKQKHGAHCRVDINDDNHWNEYYIGICLVGNFEIGRPSDAQYESLKKLVDFLKERYEIPDSKIMGHKDADHATLCPGRFFSWKKIGINR